MSATVVVPFHWKAQFLPPRARVERSCRVRDTLAVSIREIPAEETVTAFLIADVGQRRDNALFAPTADQRGRVVLSMEGAFWRAIGTPGQLQSMIDAAEHTVNMDGDVDMADPGEDPPVPERRSLDNPFVVSDGIHDVLQAITTGNVSSMAAEQAIHGSLRSWNSADMGVVGGAVRRRGAELVLVGGTVFQRCPEPVWIVTVDPESQQVSIGIGPFRDIPETRGWRRDDEREELALRFRLGDGDLAQEAALRICRSLGWQQAVVSARARVHDRALCAAPTEAANAARAGRLLKALNPAVREMPRDMALRWVGCRDRLSLEEGAVSRSLARDVVSLADEIRDWSRGRILSGVFAPPVSGSREAGGIHDWIPVTAAALGPMAEGHGQSRPDAIDWSGDAPTMELWEGGIRRRRVTTVLEASELASGWGLQLGTALESALDGSGEIAVAERLEEQAIRGTRSWGAAAPRQWTPVGIAALQPDGWAFKGDPAVAALLTGADALFRPSADAPGPRASR